MLFPSRFYGGRQRFHVTAMALGGVIISFLLLLSACGSGGTSSNAPSTATSSGGTSSGTPSTATKGAVAVLTHAPQGSASLVWSHASHQISVTIDLTGLAPTSTHPAHIHAGDCNANGPIVYTLYNVVADKAGRATTTTTISNVTEAIPSQNWSIHVHNGPGLQPADQFTPIACGTIVNSQTNPHPWQQVGLTLGPTNAANQNASGSTRLTLQNETLTVVLTMHGLVPNSEHAAHIHAGGCQSQLPGNIVHMLKNVVADGHGNATETTVIQHVPAIPVPGWYINVHASTNVSTQTGFDPIACANVITG